MEPGATPARDITLHWRTFSDAAAQAGMSRRYGGIHFKDGDLLGKYMGRDIAAKVWNKTQKHITGGD